MAFLCGRNIASGALTGAGIGALTSALVHPSIEEQMRERSNRQHRLFEDHHEPARRAGRSGRGRGGRRNRAFRAHDDLFSQILALTRLNNGGHSEVDVDNMSYEELLERCVIVFIQLIFSLLFGFTHRFGSSTKPADRQAIDNLPTQEYTGNVSSSSSTSLDRDDSLLSCGVCLEEFQNGERLKTLPCLHRYHNACIDKWLEQCAKCPICKYEVR